MNILLLGDSITEGVPGVSYVAKLEEMHPNSQFLNAGKGGDTVSSLMKRVKKMNDLNTYDHIVLFVGVNDIFGKLTTTYKLLKSLKRQFAAKDESMFKKQYQELVDYILLYNNNLIIIPPLLIGEDITNKWNQSLTGLRQVTKDIATKYTLSFLTVYEEYYAYIQDKEISQFLPLSVKTLLKDVSGLSNSNLVDLKSKERGLHLTLDGVHINSIGANIISKAISGQIKNTNQ